MGDENMLEIDEREALKLYKKNTPLAKIARKLKLPLGVVERWKDKTDWDNYKTVVGEPGHINTVSVGVGTGPGPGNKNSVTHGLTAKWIPQEMLEIINSVEGKNSLDLLWTQILIQHAAIVRAQNIMYVKNLEDNIVFIKREGTEGVTEREIQYSWDRYGKYLTAQSYAMNSLNSMILNYEKVLRYDKSDEEQALRIKKLKKELETSRSVEDKMQEYFDVLAKAVKDDK